MSTLTVDEILATITTYSNYVVEQVIYHYNNPPVLPSSWLICLFLLIGVVGMVTLFLPFFVSFLYFRQDLKKRYNASWALVTGKFIYLYLNTHIYTLYYFSIS